MKNKNFFLVILMSFLTYQCGIRISLVGLPPIGLFGLLNLNSDSDSSSSLKGYYFKEYSKSNDGKKAFDTIKVMTTEIRAAVKKPGSGSSGIEKACDGINLATAIGGGSPQQTIDFIYGKKLKSLIPTDQESKVKALIDAAVTASSTTAFQELEQDSNRRNGLKKGGGALADGFVGQASRKYDSTTKAYKPYESYSCYLDTKEGMEYVQWIEKGLFSLPYYQAMKILDGIKSKNNDDAKTKYTDREKDWDKLFGYFGAPPNYTVESYDKGYLSGRTGLFNSYGIYRSRRDDVKDVPGEKSIRNFADDIMINGFVAGRNAITNGDDAALDKAIKVVSLRFKHAIIVGGLSYAYFGYGGLKPNNADGDKTKSKVEAGEWTAIGIAHVLSEAGGMFWALGAADKALGSASSNKSKFSEADINLILQKLTGDDSITMDNVAAGKGKFYTVTHGNIKDARVNIVEKYPEFDSSYLME